MAEQAKKLEGMTTEEKVKHHYQHGQGSIQDIARVYRLTVDEVLRIIGEEEILTVRTEGDLIDEREKGPQGAPMNYGQEFRTPFDLS